MHLQKLKISCTELGGIDGKSPRSPPKNSFQLPKQKLLQLFLLCFSVNSLPISVSGITITICSCLFLPPASSESHCVLRNFTEQDLKVKLLSILSLLSNNLFNLEFLCFVLTAFKNISAIFVFEYRDILCAQQTETSFYCPWVY